MNYEGKKVYISAPITGYDFNERKAYFANIAKRVEACGMIPVNPMKNGLPLEAPKKKHMKRDFNLLTECDLILLCDDWQTADGCQKEATVALWSGIAVLPNSCIGL